VPFVRFWRLRLDSRRIFVDPVFRRCHSEIRDDPMIEYVPGTNPPTPHRSASRRRLWPYVAVIAVLAAALTVVFLWPRMMGDKPAGPAAAAGGVTSFTINASLALGPGQFVPVDGTSCAGTPPYKDLTTGTVITVTDAEGGVLATGDLKISVPDVPVGKGTYGIEVAHRGATKYDESKLRSGLLQMSVE
jgi:hypothetical protein